MNSADPSFPTITDEHQEQAAKLYSAIKADNPQHIGFFQELEDKAANAVAVAAEAPLIPLLCLAMLFGGRKNAFM